MDLIGPWHLKIANYELDFMALTMIDMITNLVELVRIENSFPFRDNEVQIPGFLDICDHFTGFMIKESLLVFRCSGCYIGIVFKDGLRLRRTLKLIRYVNGCIKRSGICFGLCQA